MKKLCCNSGQGPNNFTSCSCIDDQQSSAVRELCESDCGFFIPFIVIIFVMMFLTFWVTMPSTMATLRCVKDKERSLAVGLQTMAIRLLGSIPGPVLFGYFIDRTCIQWDSSCGKQYYSIPLYLRTFAPFNIFERKALKL